MSFAQPNTFSNEYSIYNGVKLIRGGAAYFLLVQQMIDAAKTSIHLQTYIFECDETGTEVGAALMKAAQRGVQIYILLDGYASQHLSKKFIEQLKDSGIHFRWFEPVIRSKYFYFGRRLHHKLLVTDKEYSLVGGVNISNKYNDMPTKKAWLDWALFCKGQVSFELYNLCVEFWNKSNWSKPKNKIKKTIVPAKGDDSECLVRVRRNDWVNRKNQISRTYLEMLLNAEVHVFIMSSYFLPGRIFRKSMLHAARRGVAIKVIIAGPSDVPIVKHAERYLYRWMLKNKLELYEYQNNILHGKISACDAKFVTIGSYNINNISAYASVELNLDVQNSSFAIGVEDVLQTLIQNDCVRITEKSFEQHDSFVKHIWQKICYGIYRVGFYLFTFYFKQHN